MLVAVNGLRLSAAQRETSSANSSVNAVTQNVAPPDAESPAPASLDGLLVKAVRHRPEEPQQRPLDPTLLAEILPQKAGAPYSSEKIRESIQRLYATGRFADIQVDAEQEEGGVGVTFLTKSAYFIGSVQVLGVVAPPRETQLRSATHFELGLPFSEDAIPEAIDGLDRVLEENGYFQAEITTNRQPHPDTQQMDITFEVRTGKRARLGDVVVSGSPVFPKATLLKEAQWKPGKPFTDALVQNGLDRIRKLYQNSEYLEASIAITERRFHPDTNSADLELAITSGPPIKVSVVGAAMKPSEIRKLIPIFAGGTLDDDLLQDGKRNLSDYFQSQGYFDVAVSYQRQDLPSEGSAVVYRIDRGSRRSLKEIRIAGNHYFTREVLREQMKIQPASVSLTHGRFSSKLLAEDLDAIRELYQKNGFAQAEVTSSQESSGEAPEKEMTVFIQIREGPQTRISNFAIIGNSSFPRERLQSIIDAGRGQPYSPSLVASDRDKLLTFYFDQGFRQASFQDKATLSENQTSVDLEYSIQEGPREYVGSVYLDGLEHTRPGVVDRELLLHGGLPLGQGQLLNTQRRLYDLGIFNEVDVAIQNPNGEESQKNVLINVQEARRYTLKLGLGAEVGRFGTSSQPIPNPQGINQFSPDVSLELDRLDVGGRPHTVSLGGRFSTLQKRVGITYTAPDFLNHDQYEATVKAFYDETFDVLTFTARRVEESVQFKDKKSKATTFLYRYTLSRVAVDTNILEISPALIPILARPVLVGRFNLSVIRDTRDNPVESHKGMFTSADFGIAAKQLGSQTGFVKLLLQNSTYYPIGKKLIFARSTQFGVQTPFGMGRQVTIAPAQAGLPAEEIFTNEIPVAEHFFSGGGNSHRGFAVNQAGPRDPATGFPLGGNALALNSLELRFPIWSESIGGVLFHDMGNVFTSISDFTLRQHQKSLQDPSYLPHALGCQQGSIRECNLAMQNSNYISHAVGFGLRYRTPVGPIRLDLGYNLNPTRYLIQTVGSPTNHSLTRWQFLFSIGQNF